MIVRRQKRAHKMAKGDVTERTFIMLKPDAVHRGLISYIMKRFEQKGFKLVAIKFMWVCGLTLSATKGLNISL